MNWLADHRAAALGFAVTIAYWPGLLSAAFAPRWAAIAIGVALVSKLDPREVPEWIRWILAFVVALGAASLIGSPDPRAGTMDLIFIVILCGAFLMGAGLDKCDNLMTGAAWGLAPSAFVLLFGLTDDQGRGAAGDPAGLFHNTEVFAEFAALVLAWGIAKINLPAIIAGAMPVFLLNSRVAILATAVGVLAAAWPRRWIWRAAAVGGIALAAVAMLFIFGIGKAGSADQRIILWGATIYAMTPIGNGLGWFQAAHPVEEFAHSDALQFLAEVGPLGLISLAIPVAAFALNRGTNAERALLAAASVEILVSFPLHTPAAGFLIAAVAGFMVGGRGPVLVGLPVGRGENVGAVRRAGAYIGRGLGLGGRGGGDLPDRPVPAWQAALRARYDRLHTRARKAILEARWI